MSHDDIEATKAPLIEHLIELSARLIKSLAAFVVLFLICFFFAKHIYNVLLWPFVWAAGPEIPNSSTPRCSNISSRNSSSRCSARRSCLSHRGRQFYMFVAPGLYKHERKAFLPYLIATPIFFSMGALVVYFLVFPMLIRFSLHMQQPGTPTTPPSSCCPRSATICR